MKNNLFPMAMQSAILATEKGNDQGSRIHPMTKSGRTSSC
jgi:hypothetical protein